MTITNEQRAIQRKRHARLTRGVELLAFLKWRREREGDETIGRGVEAFIVGSELNELVHLAVAERLREGERG